ncbi:MAG: hypothetical protein FI685_04880 [SAR202 cluster bacterium]|nr:hypothetical protein [Chloroflexota bacterium]MDP7231861.1 hypothetical protein [Dehalococcoidia bacterium]MDP7612676.1 hypothetical protein [Dehalococcoidia bacterium]MQG47408.1 hypothetical protein [SAR202 cluster bacterium]
MKKLSILSFLVLALFLGCGGTEGKHTDDKVAFQEIQNVETVFNFEDLIATGWKQSKQYDVTGLENAQSAYMGYWALQNSNPVTYEIRIYPSHKIAVESGTSFAEEGSGETAILRSSRARWKEGLNNRRRIVGGGDRGKTNPRYGAYIIYGNLVILCEGRTREYSIENCKQLVKRFEYN